MWILRYIASLTGVTWFYINYVICEWKNLGWIIWVSLWVLYKLCDMWIECIQQSRLKTNDSFI